MSSIGLISENDNSTVLVEYNPLKRVEKSFQSEDALEQELIKSKVYLKRICNQEDYKELS